MEKQKLYFWKIKSSQDFPLNVFSKYALTEVQVRNCASHARLMNDVISVEPMDENQVRMLHGNTYLYSLDITALRADEIWKVI